MRVVFNVFEIVLGITVILIAKEVFELKGIGLDIHFAFFAWVMLVLLRIEDLLEDKNK